MNPSAHESPPVTEAAPPRRRGLRWPTSFLPGYVRWRSPAAGGTDEAAAFFANDPPLRADLFSVDQLETHAKALAGWHEVDEAGGPDRLLPRLAKNEEVLVRAYELVIDAVENNRRISPAAEWMLDNFYLIEEQVRISRRHLPKGYSKELPHLVGGPSRGYPRVYDLALELISHVDGRVDLESLTSFVSSYQSVTTLKLGELWAVPIMLRLALLENLRRVAARIAAARLDRDKADYWADKLVATAEADPKDVVIVLADLVRSKQPMNSAFVAELARRLQGQGPALAFPMSWVEQRLGEQGINAQQLVQNESQSQAADQVSIGNSIGSLRFLASCDWKEFVENLSAVEAVLRHDPADIYSDGDFATRDRYRHAVERIARRSKRTEAEVAEEAVRLARKAKQALADAGADPSAVGGSVDRAADELPRLVENGRNGNHGSTNRAAAYVPSAGGSGGAKGADGEIEFGLLRGRAEFRDLHARSRRAAPSTHVGYYLVDKGTRDLERAVAMRPPLSLRLRRMVRRVPLALFLAAVLVISGGMTALLFAIAGPFGMRWWMMAVLALPALVAASFLGVALVNWVCTLLVHPRSLPRLDFSAGIPADCRTAVVVPTMLTSKQNVEDLLEGLEVRYLANRDRHLHFALLTDFKDATQQVMPGDEELLKLAADGVAALNEKYAHPAQNRFDRPDAEAYIDGPGDSRATDSADSVDGVGAGPAGRDDAFFLFHRPRVWNQAEGVWMGEERKRGKLDDFNQFLRGLNEKGDDKVFSAIVGRREVLCRSQYVITLDTDTQLPRDAAQDLVGTIAHPLNRAVYDPRKGRVVRGYGILQPRVAVTLPSAGKSWFVRLFAGDAGIDPYTQAVSDVYQDLFGEGSFIGKGIYDVDAFLASLGGRLPDNRILSHDLLEGSYARGGLVTDVLLYEDYPSSYAADVSRRHRWVRGDWQIASWVLPWAPGPGGRARRNPTSALSRWKIFDNLRRSLVPASLLLLLLVAWAAVMPAGYWTLVVAAILLLPAAFATALGVLRKPKDYPVSLHLRLQAEGAVRQFLQAILNLVFLPHDAHTTLDAIARTLWRIFVSRRKLLEWRTSSEAERTAGTGLGAFYRSMWACPLAAVVGGGLLVGVRPLVFDNYATRNGLWVVAAPLLVAWLLAPAVAWWLSRPIPLREVALSAEDALYVRLLARRTWRFFDLFVAPADNYLPPDNFQEHPSQVIAHRTSPTNIGLSMLSHLAAWDFGYVSTGYLLHRTQATLATLGRMERYERHFYNWYDTRTLEPLPPRYVSSVDSGNFTASLLILRPGLLELQHAPVLPPQTFSGLADTLRVLLETARGKDKVAHRKRASHLPADVLTRLDRLANELDHPPRALGGSRVLLQRVAVAAGDAVAAASPGDGDEIQWWARAFERQAREASDDLAHFATWADVNPPSEKSWRRGGGVQVSRLGKLRDATRKLDEIPTLREVADLSDGLGEIMAAIGADLASSGESYAGEDGAWVGRLRAALSTASGRAAARIAEFADAADACREFADADYGFLYDRARDLLTIGYNVDDRRRDAGHYDLLASEARLTSFTAIANGQLPQDHWFSLSRMMTTQGGEPTLLSWSGSMFEYLMPLLVMPTYENTLLDQTYRAVIDRQIEYGRQRGVPWGISESGYNATDASLNYQYRAFGVPGLGLKRGLAEDLVIAPYATEMSLMVDPAKSVLNLKRMAEDGHFGAYGFYEAIDFTPSRVPRGQESATVRSYMSHHKGMAFLAQAYALLDRPMQRRFNDDPLFKSTELLLQERIPKAAPVFPHASEASNASRRQTGEAEGILRVFRTPNTNRPAVHLLSNGSLNVMVTAAGGGYSRWREIALTRWHEDPTRDCWGTFVYLRDADSGEFWSYAYQPTLKKADTYEAVFSQARAEFKRRDGDIECNSEVSVSPEDDVELRRLTVTNRGRQRRTIEFTSYCEVVLAKADADAAHPAFSNLFVQTQLMRNRQAILATRRARSQSERPPYLLHLMAVHGPTVGEASYETDRSKFVGRGQSLAEPAAMFRRHLQDSEGSVLDPVASVRRTVTLEPGQTIKVDVVTGVADAREAAVGLIEKYHDRRLADRVFELAWTQSQVVLRQLNATEADAQLYGRLASSVIYANERRRAGGGVITRNRKNQSALWGYGISGDLPLVLLRVHDRTKIALVKQLVQAHAYWRMKGLRCDLVIWNEDASGYRQELQDEIMGLITAGTEAASLDKPGGIFVRRTEQISEEDKTLMQTVARVILNDAGGTLAEQLDKRSTPELPAVPKFVPTRARRAEVPTAAEVETRDLIFHNGIGGFTPDGREYICTTTAEDPTPAPWCNVLANPEFGTVVTESGGAYTWHENAHEFRLTPWYNDPVSDTTGEAYYVRDEESGRFFSPCPLPARGPMPYTTRHGFGYTAFHYAEGGIETEMWTYVAIDAPVKFVTVKLSNRSGRTRRLGVTGFVEWVLADLKSKSQLHVYTELDPKTGAVLARNRYSEQFGERVAFFDCSEAKRTVTGDRTEFLGRNGSPADPAAMGRIKLSGKIGAALDPCAAIQTVVEIPDGGDKEVTFILGAARSREAAAGLVERHKGVPAAHRALEEVWKYWNTTLGTLYVETPDPAINVLANGWLPYQVLACRYWARSGFYQSGGAYGFRDQLQDVMALLYAAPKLMREHILRACEHQFKEGDVQHWWHPPSGRGVRTHFSDDFLWLPLVVARYVTGTGDTGLLDETVHFLEARAVPPDEESYYDLPNRSDEAGTVYDHCVRSIENGMNFGEHGLPKIGCGDWNDGMNLIGEHGRGESVWLGFFYYLILKQFSEVARRRGETDFADKCLATAGTLMENVEKNSWDGEWYRRAYFDNGEPLGSAGNPECQIDSLPQSWSVLAGSNDPERSRSAMDAVDDRLVRRDARLIQLFDPPFDTSHLNPGYIKGYVPGVRENGGQYTHAAVWTVMAYAEMGDRKRAWELFNLINPVNHGNTRAGIDVYKVEPYVVAADVYAVPPHVGRGGWTWYTGSAGWMYRLMLESLLGLHLEVDRLRFTPLLPEDWKGFKMSYRHRDTHHRITIQNHGGEEVTRVTVDGVEQPDLTAKLFDDRRDHHILVELGPPPNGPEADLPPIAPIEIAEPGRPSLISAAPVESKPEAERAPEPTPPVAVEASASSGEGAP